MDLSLEVCFPVIRNLVTIIKFLNRNLFVLHYLPQRPQDRTRAVHVIYLAMRKKISLSSLKRLKKKT